MAGNPASTRSIGRATSSSRSERGPPVLENFLLHLLAQLTTIWGVGAAVWLVHRSERHGLDAINTSLPALLLTESAEAALRFGGVDALKKMLAAETGKGVYAVDETGRELMGRELLPAVVDEARFAVAHEQERRWVREVAAAGHRYLLFSIAGKGVPQEFELRRERHLFPLVPVIAATIASFVFAALLAWYFSKPIRHLRLAFESLAEGNFDLRLDAVMGRRRDDLSDLGRDFDRMAGRIKMLVEGQRRLLKDISHELRSPLARLQIAIGLVRQQPDRLDAGMARIEQESVRMDKLIGELLALSKLEAGGPGHMDGEVNLDELLGGIVEDARYEAAQDGKQVEFAWDGEAVLLGNAELLHRAIENVVRNAVKFAPSGTSVELAVMAGDGRLKLSIADRGPGVANEELELIFEPFFRGTGPQAANTAGYGLGLSIARRIFEAHGGSVRAFNREGGGLRVDMELPLAR